MKFPIPLHNPFLLAPLAGYTDPPFRRIARQFGAGMVFTELISADGIVRANAKTLSMLSFSPEEKPYGIQIFGNDPVIMSEAAHKVLSHNPDCIDINSGCCVPKVCNNGKGAGLLKDVTLLHAIAGAVVKHAGVPVSVKIRLGFTRGTQNYFEVVSALQDAGVSFITVHGRTRDQFFSGKADWEAIQAIARSARIPIVGNGDICSFDGAHERLASSGCSAVMIGRAALGNPWIFSGQQPLPHDRVTIIKKHYDLALRHYGDYGMILMRKHIGHYLKGFHNASKLRQEIIHCGTIGGIFSALDTIR